MLKFGQDVALRGTENWCYFLGGLAALHTFLYEKSQFLQKTQFLPIKKCVAPGRNTFSGKNNISFPYPLGLQPDQNFSIIGPVVVNS